MILFYLFIPEKIINLDQGVSEGQSLEVLWISIDLDIIFQGQL